jgi:putative oxidoreductase
MYDNGPDPKPFLPALEPLYEVLLLRCAAGGLLLVHGAEKVGHLDNVVATMARVGLSPPHLIAWVVTLTETVGATCVVLGLFTRFFAAACAIDLAVIAFDVFLPRGFSLGEGPLLWGLVFLTIALRGGGPLSIDRLIGREL